MRIAACRYPLTTLGSFAEFADKQARLLQHARAAGARLALLPEYLSLELAGALSEAERGDLAASLATLQQWRDDWLGLYARLARELDLVIVAGSFILRGADGRYRNRCDWFGADGRHGFQDKLQLTAFEKATGLITPGEHLQVCDFAGRRCAIAVCYDAEFPLPVRAQREAGARLLLVPSCTDTPAGATRVRVGCLARALENRMFVACAVTAGELPWSPALDTNSGEAAIFAPMDYGLPADGVLAQTRPGQDWAIADLEFERLATLPAQVANDRDWAAAPPCTVGGGASP